MFPLVSLYRQSLSLRQVLLAGIIFLFVLPQEGEAQIMRSMPVFAGYLGYPLDFGPMPSHDAAVMRTAQTDDWDGWTEEEETTAFAESKVSDEAMGTGEVIANKEEESGELDWAKDLDYESAEAEANEWVPYSEEFVLKPEESEGIKMTGMDPNSNLVLIEDRLLGKFSIRVQKIRVSHLELKWYDEAGKMIKYKEATHLPIGTEIPYQIDKWPQGRYTLMVRIDDGNWQEKKIIKPKDAARL